jgi:hypothetical protein
MKKKFARPADAREKFGMTLSLARFGAALVRKKAKAKRPRASSRELQGIVELWFRQRPGAELGDCDPNFSRVRTWRQIRSRLR